MGQKTHPIGLRLGIVRQSSSRWFATKDMPALLKEDELIRKYLKQRLGHAAISEVHIERRPGKVTITVHTGRPGQGVLPGVDQSWRRLGTGDLPRRRTRRQPVPGRH